MSNLERYNNVFYEVIGVTHDDLDDLVYQGVASWDSIAHMQLVASLEDEFNIEMDADDIIEFSSYKIGKEIIAKYGIEL